MPLKWFLNSLRSLKLFSIKMKAQWKSFILKHVAWFLYRILWATWKIKIHEPPELINRIKNKKTFILAHWHGDELGLLYLVKRYHLATMVSTSQDGELMDFVFKKLSGRTSRGSSTRGGVRALKGLIRLTRQGHPMSVAVDGPKGPLHEPKSGVFELSKLTQAPIFAISMHATQQWVSKKSWNQALLPKPFSRIEVYIDPLPLSQLTKNDNPRDPHLSQQLKQKINFAKQQASDLIKGF